MCHNPPLTKLTSQILPRHHLLHLTHETLTLIFSSPSITMAAATLTGSKFSDHRATIFLHTSTCNASSNHVLRSELVTTTTSETTLTNVHRLNLHHSSSSATAYHRITLHSRIHSISTPSRAHSESALHRASPFEPPCVSHHSFCIYTRTRRRNAYTNLQPENAATSLHGAIITTIFAKPAMAAPQFQPPWKHRNFLLSATVAANTADQIRCQHHHSFDADLKHHQPPLQIKPDANRNVPPFLWS